MPLLEQGSLQAVMRCVFRGDTPLISEPLSKTGQGGLLTQHLQPSNAHDQTHGRQHVCIANTALLSHAKNHFGSMHQAKGRETDMSKAGGG